MRETALCPLRTGSIFGVPDFRDPSPISEVRVEVTPWSSAESAQKKRNMSQEASPMFIQLLIGVQMRNGLYADCLNLISLRGLVDVMLVRIYLAGAPSTLRLLGVVKSQVCGVGECWFQKQAEHIKYITGMRRTGKLEP